MIKTNNLSFNYDNKVFFNFKNIDLKIGEDLLIIGNSGIGKTTLLHLLAGLLKTDSGSINIYGQELKNFSNSLTVKENLQLAQYIGKKNNNDRIENILNNLNILDKSDKKTNQLSQGEKQRVSIAMAIVNSPKLILADEPTSSLDDFNCTNVINLLKKQASDYGAQLIVITHDSRLKEHFKKQLKL